MKTDMFKKKLDEWLRDIPDTPKIDDYGTKCWHRDQKYSWPEEQKKGYGDEYKDYPDCDVALSQIKGIKFFTRNTRNTRNFTTSISLHPIK